MIKPKADIISLCDKRFTDLDINEMRLIIMNYIYYTKGVVVSEVMTASITQSSINGINDFLAKARIAYEYFEQ